MPMQTPAKTWQFDLNNALSAPGSNELTIDGLWLAIKNALLGFASNPWTVVASSDASSTASSDLWSGASKLNHSSGAHSWIVLKQTGMAAGNFQLCIDLNSSTAYSGSIYISHDAGFTGGTTSARPTATDEQAVVSSTTLINIATDSATRWSVMQTDDGTSTRIIVAAAGTIRLLAAFETPINAVAAWNDPAVVLWLASTVTNHELFTSFSWKGRINGTNANLVTLAEGANAGIGPNDSVWGNIPNEVSGEWPQWPLGLACNTVGVRGRHAALADLWSGTFAVSTGDTYPVSASDFIQVSYLILPWDGGAFNLS